MIQFQVEPVVAAGAEPEAGIVAVARQRAQVELHRQLQMVLAFGVAQQQVQLAQGLAVLAYRQVGRDHLDVGGGVQGELPQALVVQAEAPGRFRQQPGMQRIRGAVQPAQPVLEQLRGMAPCAGLQRVALGFRGLPQQGGREQGPGEVAHRRGAQSLQQSVQQVVSGHGQSIAPVCRVPRLWPIILVRFLSVWRESHGAISQCRHHRAPG